MQHVFVSTCSLHIIRMMIQVPLVYIVYVYTAISRNVNE